MVGRLNRGQRIAVLAGLAWVLYVFGHFLIGVIFSGGFVVYEPVNPGVNWTFVWQSAVQFAIWVVLAAGWVFIAVRTLRAGTPTSDEADEA